MSACVEYEDVTDREFCWAKSRIGDLAFENPQLVVRLVHQRRDQIAGALEIFNQMADVPPDPGAEL